MHVLTGVIVGFVVAQAAILATTVYLHRGLAHRAVTLHPAVVGVLRFFLWITTGMKPREWAAVHRRHHSSTDTVDDPHSPLVLGFWRVQLANAALYRRTARDGEWLIRLTEAAPEIERTHATGDVAVRGPASDVLLVLLRRLDPHQVEVFGDRTVLDHFLTHAAF